ncbi:ethanolamine ammonia-lyase subunit EutC [Xylophilus ampelinus]|uniref:Ethanolamine ammonia-lyase small subunit n=1 Tax=Xylophilus ampelinus TaxID=54067 RepID=A0A318SQ23_9BURK|nr:ethanolamine ammonia-lyase subunit EutC [Xylophilus ampelinus]MCS4508977.1 ethanolamine ammonia-lyase subunit EutC [Xylophilus ampelinus]PYE79542.1 ethanolamine ammonia-lyase light chain [Xylophilus ampelinus]
MDDVPTPSGTTTPPDVQPDAWTDWRTATPARIALGRAGVATPTAETLRFGWAHALARDAIHTSLDAEALVADLQADGWQVLQTRSQAPDRTTYLRRPELGRRLEEDAAEALRAAASPDAPALCIVVGDGLSSLAVQRHAQPLLQALRTALPADVPLGPVVVATQARVALADPVGECLGAAMTAMLIGERPGLSSPDSLGIYLTYGPRTGRRDAERNCISNVRPQGLGYAEAARKLAWLVGRALHRRLTGVALKDESDRPVLTPGTATPRMAP